MNKNIIKVNLISYLLLLLKLSPGVPPSKMRVEVDLKNIIIQRRHMPNHHMLQLGMVLILFNLLAYLLNLLIDNTLLDRIEHRPE